MIADCLLILLLTLFYYGVPGFPLEQRHRERKGGAEQKGERGTERGTASVRLKEEEKEQLS